MNEAAGELFLAIDTATAGVAVALVRDSTVLAERAVRDAQRHAEILAPAVQSVVHQSGSSLAELSGIVVGTGPGPFTGLRVGVVTATTLGYALRVPVHGVCSLDAFAQLYAAGFAPASTFVVATDARRKEVYWARYRIDDAGHPVRLDGPSVDRPAHLTSELRALPVVGGGGVMYPAAFGPPTGLTDIAAPALVTLARRSLAAGQALPVTPLYLRRPDVREPSAPKSTLLPSPRRGSAAPETDRAGAARGTGPLP